MSLNKNGSSFRFLCFGMVSCRLNGLVLSHTSVFRQYLVLDAECMTDNQCLSDFFYRLVSS